MFLCTSFMHHSIIGLPVPYGPPSKKSRHQALSWVYAPELMGKKTSQGSKFTSQKIGLIIVNENFSYSYMYNYYDDITSKNNIVNHNNLTLSQYI